MITHADYLQQFALSPFQFFSPSLPLAAVLLIIFLCFLLRDLHIASLLIICFRVLYMKLFFRLLTDLRSRMFYLSDIALLNLGFGYFGEWIASICRNNFLLFNFLFFFLFLLLFLLGIILFLKISDSLPFILNLLPQNAEFLVKSQTLSHFLLFGNIAILEMHRRFFLKCPDRGPLGNFFNISMTLLQNNIGVFDGRTLISCIFVRGKRYTDSLSPSGLLRRLIH